MPRTNTPDDFWGRVKVGAPDECWPWTGSVTDRGYGKLSFTGRNMRAHQVAFLLEHGERPPAVMHSCDNRPCCNPAHLSAGTNGLNNTDRARKGRSAHPKGMAHPNAKLTDDKVREMRRLASEGIRSGELAKRYEINANYVHAVLRGARWSHVA